jgi:hypothetical protein
MRQAARSRAALVAILALVAGACTAKAATDVLAPVRFAKGPGWHVGVSKVEACPGAKASQCSQVASWASTAPWRDCAECAGADKTLRSIGRDGIVIYLSLARERFRYPNALRWPPRIRAGEVLSPIEGHAPRFGLFSRSGRLRGLSAALYVWFGRPHPTARQLARAEAELRTARLP